MVNCWGRVVEKIIGTEEGGLGKEWSVAVLVASKSVPNGLKAATERDKVRREQYPGIRVESESTNSTML